MSQLAFYYDQRRCTGCKTCQVACQDKNDLCTSLIAWRKVLEYGGGTWSYDEAGCPIPNGVFRYFMSEACHHCQNPACVASCPVGAAQKDEETGIVWIDHERCIACGTCRAVCPYEAPVMDPVHGYMTKCDFCRDQVFKTMPEGEECFAAPECVLACNQRALDWGTIDELKAKYPEAEAGCYIEPLPVPFTDPSTLIRPHRDAQRAGEGKGILLTTEAEYR